MNRFFAVLLLALAVAIPTYAKKMTTTTIKLPTIQCGSCKKTIESKVKPLHGVESVKVDLEAKDAVVRYDADVTSLGAIEKTISMAGYDANNTKADRTAQKKLDVCCQPRTE